MISVVIVNYHSSSQTERAVRSVMQDSVEKEIHIVDNTCTADERDVLEGMRKGYGFSLILNDENIGFARACNQAFSRSRGKYIFLLNPDAFVAPACLDLLRSFLEDLPLAGAASPQVYWDDEMRYLFSRYSPYTPLQDLCVRLSSFSCAFRNYYSLRERSKNVSLWKSSRPVRVKNLHGGAVMVRRAAAEKSGGLFDERFFLFFEDTDLFFRLRERGYGLYIIPGAKAVHNYNHSGKKLEYLSRMSRLYHEKHFSRSFLSGITSHIPEGSWKESYHDYGVWNAPPSFPVPDAFQGGYLFEWSPNSMFVPSIGCFDRGRNFSLSKQVWDLLGDGRYYSRFSFPSARTGKCATGCWTKEI